MRSRWRTPISVRPSLPARTRKAEGWLSIAPNSAALATALGRLCAQQSLWGKSQQYLERALAIEESPLAWETLGDCYAGSNDAATALTCYANALRLARGEATVAVGTHALRGPVDTRALVFEERSEHGVPRLPARVESRCGNGVRVSQDFPHPSPLPQAGEGIRQR